MLVSPRKLAHSKGVGWMEYWDFINCSCDLSHPEGQLMIEEYLKELSDSSRNLSSQDLLTVHEDGENPLLLGTPGSPGGTVARQHVFDGVPGKLFCEDGVKEVLSSDKDTQSNDDINAIVDSLADLLDKNLSFNEETDFQLSSTSDPSPDSSRSTPIFLAG